jgi:hypothetical protein
MQVRSLALPKGTELTLSAPQYDGFPPNGWAALWSTLGSIALRNRYCKLKIQTGYEGGTQGISDYADVLRLHGVDDPSRLRTNMYTISIDATFELNAS